LETVSEGPVIAIHQPESVIKAMDEWNTVTHGESGLIRRVRESSHTLAEAEQETLAFVEDFVPAGLSPMCGNSICQDRRFLAREMPKLEAFFHYRNLDVSTIKELVTRWKPEVLKNFQKESRHQALDDIYESIAELRFYRHHVFSI
ncbi:MAG: oligoribonuclease, partial [Gammaproteobacteria bacterium]